MSPTQSNSAHGNFKEKEASRPDFNSSSQVHFTKTANPGWSFGDGPNGVSSSSSSSSSSKGHISIDPYEEGRPTAFNHKLLISGIAPRPIAFLSTCSPDGSAENLAPFSYFNIICNDPPLFVVGFTPNSIGEPKDTLRNLLESKECVINIISENWIEAANAACIDAPYGASEWDITGLTKDYSCETVKAPRVKEAVFSVEAKLESFKEWESKATPGKKSSVTVILEGTRFWVREDAINEDKNLVDLAVLKPMSRMGGITYGRITEAIELLRPQFQKDLGGQEGLEKLKNGKK